PASLVTVEPWNSNLISRSKSTRRGSLWRSPIGFLGHSGRNLSETPGFPGCWRKCHAETTEPSGKYGFRKFRDSRQSRNFGGLSPAILRNAAAGPKSVAPASVLVLARYSSPLPPPG